MHFTLSVTEDKSHVYTSELEIWNVFKQTGYRHAVLLTKDGKLSERKSHPYAWKWLLMMVTHSKKITKCCVTDFYLLKHTILIFDKC